MAHCIETILQEIHLSLRWVRKSGAWSQTSMHPHITFHVSLQNSFACFPKNWFAKEHAWDSRANLASLTCPCGSREKISRLSPVSLFVFTLAPGLLFDRSCALDQRKNMDSIAVYFYFRFLKHDNQHQKDHAFVCTLITIPVMNDRSVRAHRWNCLKAEAHKVLLLSEIKTIKRRSLFGIFTKSGCYQTGNEERGTNNGTGKWKKQNQKQNKKPREQRMGNGVTDRARD